ncbi:hypothetical protein EVAR_92580_1 [Eumeta japonica]|uniref:Uncharacterized protein n=1 Tax=Eumeta variegata TaxID=151549 RepID=A0A4C1T003_EUMVA|nr:hypothetical protein EVAR_92580_1 [Eumeta japonica]
MLNVTKPSSGQLIIQVTHEHSYVILNVSTTETASGTRDEFRTRRVLLPTGLDGAGGARLSAPELTRQCDSSRRSAPARALSRPRARALPIVRNFGIGLTMSFGRSVAIHRCCYVLRRRCCQLTIR